MSHLVMPADQGPLPSLKAKAQADVDPSQRKAKSSTKALQEPLPLKGKSKSGADKEPAQGMSKGKTKMGRAVGVSEMQSIVVELTKLKRDLKQWRIDTERSMPRWLL